MNSRLSFQRMSLVVVISSDRLYRSRMHLERGKMLWHVTIRRVNHTNEFLSTLWIPWPTRGRVMKLPLMLATWVRAIRIITDEIDENGRKKSTIAYDGSRNGDVKNEIWKALDRLGINWLWKAIQSKTENNESAWRIFWQRFNHEIFFT